MEAMLLPLSPSDAAPKPGGRKRKRRGPRWGMYYAKRAGQERAAPKRAPTPVAAAQEGLGAAAAAGCGDGDGGGARGEEPIERDGGLCEKCMWIFN